MSEATSTHRPATVGVRDLKNQLSKYLARVRSGEELTITEHGRPIARLTSVGPEVDRMAALVDAGIVLPAHTSERRVPSTRVQLGPGESIAELVSQQRR